MAPDAPRQSLPVFQLLCAVLVGVLAANLAPEGHWSSILRGIAPALVTTLITVVTLLYAGPGLRGQWAFHFAARHAPSLEADGSSARVSLEWSQLEAFPEDFSLLSLGELLCDAEGVSGALVRSLETKADVYFRPGSHRLHIKENAALQVCIPDSPPRCEVSVDVGPAGPSLEAVLLMASVELPRAKVTNIAQALQGLWEHWTLASKDSAGALLRRVCCWLLTGLELALPIRLSKVEATTVGEEVFVFFSGSVGPVPFYRIDLPPCVLPRLRAPLSQLLSPQMLAGQQLRKGATPPALHPAAIESIQSHTDIVCQAVAVNTILNLGDGTTAAFETAMAAEGGSLHVQCDAKAVIDLQKNVVHAEVSSFSIDCVDKPGCGLKGSSSASISLAQKPSSRNKGANNVADVLFDALREQRGFDPPLHVELSASLAEGSELPKEILLRWIDVHPLMQGRQNMSLRTVNSSLSGRGSWQAEFPLTRKRDLLRLPVVDGAFKVAFILEEDENYYDDGFAKIQLQKTMCSMVGRVYSETLDDAQQRVCLESKVEASGQLCAEVLNETAVQFLREAERFAATVEPAATAGMPSPTKGKELIKSPSWTMLVGARPREDGQYFSVRSGDLIAVDTSGSLEGTLKCTITPVEKVRTEFQRSTSAELFDCSPTLPNLREAASNSTWRLSFADSVGDLKVGGVSLRLGDLSATFPKIDLLRVHVSTAEINTEGIGVSSFQVTWEGLDPVKVQHISKLICTDLPLVPCSGAATVEIGEMGRINVKYDDELDVLDLATKFLDDASLHEPYLELASMLSLDTLLLRLLNFARVVRNVLVSEGIKEPKDVIPYARMARVVARILLEIGTNGMACVKRNEASAMEVELQAVVTQAVEGRGLDVGKFTRMLWDHLPPEPRAFVQRYTAEVDFVLRWLNTVLYPTRPYEGTDPALLRQEPPSHDLKDELEKVGPSAFQLYEIVRKPRLLTTETEAQITVVAPYLTMAQVDYLLRCTGLTRSTRDRLVFLLQVKRRVAEVARGYGGLAFMTQGMAVGFFLTIAIRCSFLVASEIKRQGSLSATLRRVRTSSSSLKQTSRWQALLKEQNHVASELARLQNKQASLLEEANRLLHGGMKVGLPSNTDLLSAGADVGAVRLEDEVAPTFLDLVTRDHRCANAKMLIRASESMAQQQQVKAAQEPILGMTAVDDNHYTFDLGCSLLGPTEVAVLLQSGLAAVPPGRQVQQNQRMLIEFMVSQPPLFVKGVLYELSNNGSARALSNHLMALLDLKQDAVKPSLRLDVASLLSSVLNVQMPRRADFMAGGTQARESYVWFVTRAARQVLELCYPYVALKHWLQRAEVPVPNLGVVPRSSSLSIGVASRAVQEADSLGAAWLRERGDVWEEGPPSTPRPGTRENAIKLYIEAFARCRQALSEVPLLLHEEWMRDFMARNYDALTVLSVLRNVQDNIDKTRYWVDSQMQKAPKSPGFKGPNNLEPRLWSKDPLQEARFVDCLLEVLFYNIADREAFRQDPLMQLLIDEPPGHANFTIVSAMGVITEGSHGTEMAETYERLRLARGVQVVRADTATFHSVDYNGAQIMKAVQESVKTPWGWVGYSQGCANAFRAESLMLQGTPPQQGLMQNFRCRHLICSAANGSAHATCGDWKIVRALVDAEHFVKRFQASMSTDTQQMFVELIGNALTSKVASALFGSVQSLTHEGARKMWRDGQSARVPSTLIRGVIEPHTTPECLEMIANILEKQMAYSNSQDTQVAVEEAVGYPIGIENANAGLLKQVEVRGKVQRTHHWTPLKEEVLFLATKKDEPTAVFDTPKDRHIFPWLEMNMRFGFVERLEPFPNS